METKEGKKKKDPFFVHGETKPKDVPGSKWIPQRHVGNRDQIVGWTRVSTEPPGAEGDPFLWPPEIPEEQRVTQGHFMEKVDKSSKEKSAE